MVRFDYILQQGKPVLRIEGRLLRPWLSELRRALAAPPYEKATALELGGLSFVDPECARELLELRRRGVQLLNASPFIDGLLKLQRESRG
jgi:hypothetical protein